MTSIDDALLDGAQLVPIIARATNYLSTTNIVSVEDNESAGLTLAIPKSTVESAGSLVGQGQVVSSALPSKSATVTLIPSDTNVVQVPPKGAHPVESNHRQLQSGDRG